MSFQETEAYYSVFGANKKCGCVGPALICCQYCAGDLQAKADQLRAGLITADDFDSFRQEIAKRKRSNTKSIARLASEKSDSYFLIVLGSVGYTFTEIEAIVAVKDNLKTL